MMQFIEQTEAATKVIFTYSSSLKIRQFCALFTALSISACGLAMDNEARLDRGEGAFDDGDYRAAIIDSKNVLLDEPDNLRGRLLLGKASVEAGDGAAAEKELRRALELGANKENTLLLLARALLLQRSYQIIIDEIILDEVPAASLALATKIKADAHMGLLQPIAARELYAAVLTLEPDNVDAQLGIASTHISEGNFLQARSTLDHVTDTYPTHARSWLASGSLHLSARNYAGAQSNFETAIELAEHQQNGILRAQALAALAETLFAQNKPDEARKIVDRLVELSPDSLQSQLLTARVAILDQDWQTTQQILQSVLRVVPEERSAQMMLGVAHLQSGNLSQAEMYLSAVVAALPQHTEARRLLVETRLQMRKNEEAEATLLPLVSGTGVDPRFLAMAARASFGQGETDEAIDYLRQSVQQEPSNIDLKFQLASALIQVGRAQEVDEVLAAMDTENLGDNQYRRDALLVMASLRNGPSEEAALAARELAEKWPNNFTAYNFLGTVELSLQNYVAARSSIEKAVELSPDNVTSQQYLAMVDEAEGKLTSAHDRYTGILEDNPKATWAMLALARISIKSEDADAAIAWLEQIRRIDELTIAPRAILAKLYLSKQNYSSAMEVAKEALAVNSDIAELHALKGGAEQGLAEYNAAADSYRRAMNLEQDKEEYRLLLAKAQRLAGDDAGARRTLESTELKNLPSVVTLVALKADAGDLGGAMEIALELQERFPDSPVPYALEAELHVTGGDLGAASAAYDRALSIEVTRNHALRAHRIRAESGRDDAVEPLELYLEARPLDSEVRMVHAESLQSVGDNRAAIGAYESVIASDADNAVALNNLAWVYFLERDERAEETARRAQELLPNNGSIADTLGWILVETGSVEDGAEVLRRAVQLANGRPEVRYHLAVALSRLGDSSEAKKTLQEIIQGNQEFASRVDAERLLSEL